jgi:hypothetical protein
MKVSLHLIHFSNWRTHTLIISVFFALTSIPISTAIPLHLDRQFLMDSVDNAHHLGNSDPFNYVNVWEKHYVVID